MRAFLSRHWFASLLIGVAIGFALGWFGADRVHASGAAGTGAALALWAFRRRAASGGPVIGQELPPVPEVPEVREADAADDSAEAEAVRSAREDAERDAVEGWTSDRTRKLPGFEAGKLIAAFLIGAWAYLSPSLGTCQESNKNAPPGPEAVPFATVTAPEACKPLDGPFPAPVPGGPEVGIWFEGGRPYVCPCYSRPEQFGEVTMVPGGCRTPGALPLIALRPEGWAYVTGGIEASNMEIRNLRNSREDARNQRDLALQEAARLSEVNGELIEERDAACGSIMAGIGGGALAGGLIVGLVAFLATR